MGYLKHSITYLVKLLALVAAIYALAFASGASTVSAGSMLDELINGRNGHMLFAALAVLAALYPKFGFVRRSLDADLKADRDEIIRAMAASHLTVSEDSETEMTFVPSSPLRRLWNMFDDAVSVSADGEGRIVLYGMRKEAVRIEYLIKAYTDSKYNRE